MSARERSQSADAGTPKRAPIVLNKADVVAAARVAFNERRLSIQNGNEGDCLYRDPNGNPCVIGAALSDADAKRFDARYESNQDPGVRTLIEEGLVASDDPEFLCNLQAAHDMDDLPELRELLFVDGAGNCTASTTDDSPAPGTNP